MADSTPKVAILSLREIRPVANYGGLREAEDALVEAMAAGLYRVLVTSPRFTRGRLAKPGVRLVLGSTRVVRPYRIEHHQGRGGEPADVLLVLARDLGDASALVGLPDWHTLGNQVLVHIERVTERDLRRYADLVQQLRRRADALFAGSEMPRLGHLRAMPGRLSTVDVVPPLLDVLAFPVRPDPTQRTIDVFSPGSVPVGQHQLLRQWADRNEGSYQHDIGQLGAVTSVDQHRRIFTSMATRARLFLTNAYTYSLRQLGPSGGARSAHFGVHTRFFEAMAAGCVLVGDLPMGSRLFAEYVAPAGPLLLPLDAERLPGDVLAALDDVEHSAELGARARATALGGNDVAHRWKQMAELVGIRVADGIERRIAELAQLAERAERGENPNQPDDAERPVPRRWAGGSTNGSADPAAGGHPDQAFDRS